MVPQYSQQVPHLLLFHTLHTLAGWLAVCLIHPFVPFAFLCTHLQFNEFEIESIQKFFVSSIFRICCVVSFLPFDFTHGDSLSLSHRSMCPYTQSYLCTRISRPSCNFSRQCFCLFCARIKLSTAKRCSIDMYRTDRAGKKHPFQSSSIFVLMAILWQVEKNHCQKNTHIRINQVCLFYHYPNNVYGCYWSKTHTYAHAHIFVINQHLAHEN